MLREAHVPFSLLFRDALLPFAWGTQNVCSGLPKNRSFESFSGEGGQARKSPKFQNGNDFEKQGKKRDVVTPRGKVGEVFLPFLLRCTNG